MLNKCVFSDVLAVMPALTLLATTGMAAPVDKDFSSNLPLFSIHTTQAINADSKVMGTMQVYNRGEGQRNCLSDTVLEYNGAIGVKWRGNSSLSFDQKKYTLETRSNDSTDVKVSLLDMPAESDWVLLAPYNDISLMRDVFAFQLWNEMGHWGPHTRMCEVLVNDEYRGVYILSEQIKRGKQRVDIAKLKEDDLTGRDVTGGYIVRVDAFDEEDATFTSTVPGIQPAMWGSGGTGTVTWTVYYPKKKNLQPAQMSYISDYIRQVEESFQSADYTDPATGYAQWIDVASFVDYFIHTEVSLNADGFKRSSYFYKDKDPKSGGYARLQAGPVWDYNLAYGNCNFCNANNTEAWVYEGCYTNPTPAMWKRLVGDPSFMAAVRERYAYLRRTLLSQASIDHFIDSQAALLDEAQQRHFQLYSNLLVSNSGNSGNNGGWGNWGGWGGAWGGGWGGGNTNPVSSFAAYTVASYAEEISVLKEWFAKRLAFLDRQWQYDGSASLAPCSTDRLSVHTYFSAPDQLNIESDRSLSRIEVYSLSGHLLSSHVSASGAYRCSLSVPSHGGGSVIVNCYTLSGQQISARAMDRGY